MSGTPVPDTIRRMRERLRLQVKEVAAYIGVEAPTQSRYENGERRVPAGRLPRLAEILQTTPEALCRPLADTVPVDVETLTAEVARLKAIVAEISQRALVSTIDGQSPRSTKEDSTFSPMPSGTGSATMGHTDLTGRVISAELTTHREADALLNGSMTVGSDISARGVFICPPGWGPGVTDTKHGCVIRLTHIVEDGQLAIVKFREQLYSGRFETESRYEHRWFKFDNGRRQLAGDVRVVAEVLLRTSPVD